METLITNSIIILPVVAGLIAAYLLFEQIFERIKRAWKSQSD